MLNVLIKLDEPLGIDLGPNFDLVSNVGNVTPSTATKAQLLAGINVAVEQTATQITVYSEGTCTNGITFNISDLPAPIDFDLDIVCDNEPYRGRVNIRVAYPTGGYGSSYFYTKTWYTSQFAAETALDSDYLGPYPPDSGIVYGTGIYFDCQVATWVAVADAYGNKTIKSITSNCPPAPPPTTTQYVPFTTTTSTTPNPNDPYKSYLVNLYICDQACTPNLYNQTITVPQAGNVQIGKYYLSATNPNISYLILAQIGWSGNSGNDITNFTAYDFCYQACGIVPTTTTTTTILSAPINTVFAKYDVVPGTAQGVNTVFVKYDVQ